MLLNDRFVGTFGIVPAGDKTEIVKLSVAAVRAGFRIVVLRGHEQICPLGVRDRKKPHECYHVFTEDTKMRAAMNRLVKEHGVEELNLALDIGASNLIVTTGRPDWWVGPEIGPTLLMPNGTHLYVFDTTDADPADMPDLPIPRELLMVPPSTLGGGAVQLVGQLNYLTDNKKEETTVDPQTADIEDGTVPDTLWNNDAQDLAQLTDRVEALEIANREMAGTLEALREGMLVALGTIAELRDKER